MSRKEGMTKRRRPSVDVVRELLEYSPETGELRWKVDRTGGTKAGDVAGYVNNHGYRVVKVLGKLHMASNVIWAVHTGEWPPEGMHVDHRDTDKLNNKWENLRLATPSQNNANRRVNSTKIDPLKGVYYFKDRRKWAANVKKDRKSIFLGYYDSPEEAHAAYCKAANDLHGEFARTA